VRKLEEKKQALQRKNTQARAMGEKMKKKVEKYKDLYS